MPSKEFDRLKKGIAESEFPSQLYKYRDLGLWTFEIIQNAAMWFATPSSFNDPFDCNLSETHNHSEEDLKAYLTSLGTNPEMQAKMMETLRTNPSEIRNLSIKARTEAVNKQGILSLSKTNSSILMWSHYAKKHAGVVLGFEILKDANFFFPPQFISYANTYEELNYFRDRPRTIHRNLTTKSKLWEYEEEIRILKRESRAWKFNRECLTDVFFGCKTPQADIEKFVAHCRDNGFAHARFSKAEMEHGSFSLRFVPL